MRRFVVSGILVAAGLALALGSTNAVREAQDSSKKSDEAKVDSIISQLSSPDSTVRVFATLSAAKALRDGSEAAQKAIPILLTLLKSDKCRAVRAGAAAALSETDDSEVIETLLNVAEDEGSDPMLKWMVLSGFRERGLETEECRQMALKNIRSSNVDLALESMRVLRNSGRRQDLEELLKVYVDFHEHPDSSLIKAPPLPGTWIYFSNAYEEVSSELSSSLICLAKMAPDMLEPLLSSPNPKFKLDAAVAFTSQFDTRAVPALLYVLRKAQDWHLREQAATALGTLGLRLSGKERDEVVSALKAAMKDKHTEEGWGGTYRPVVYSAYGSLRLLGVEVDEPEDARHVPKPAL